MFLREYPDEHPYESDVQKPDARTRGPARGGLGKVLSALGWQQAHLGTCRGKIDRVEEELLLLLLLLQQRQ